MGLLSRWIRGGRKLTQQRSRDRRAAAIDEQLADEDHAPFTLYLRPFTSTGRVRIPLKSVVLKRGVVGRHHRVRDRHQCQAVSRSDPRSLLPLIVGWALSAVNDRHLTLRALDMAVKRRCPDPGLLHHSDQGCTYASEDYRTRLEQHGIACSMSRRGNCYDNAVMESFFATIKSEEGERFESYAHAKEGLVRLHRSVLYPASPPLHPWLNQPGGVRTTDHSGRITKPSTISDQAQVSISSRFEVLRLAIPLSACLGAKVATPETAGTPCALGCAETLNG